MATYNRALHSLSLNDIKRVSEEYLMGWQDLMGNGYPFRVKGLNSVRAEHGLEPLTREMSFAYRLDYIRANFSYDEIYRQISEYLQTARVDKARWTRILLFNCRFGREYAKFFKELLGAKAYREVSEFTRVKKLCETQVEAYGGVGLGGAQTKQKAQATNLVRHHGTNVMDDVNVRTKLAETNLKKYGGISPFASKLVREKALQVRNPELWNAIAEYKRTGQAQDVLCESRFEFQIFKLLAARFGKDDVMCQYGIHPSDKRYPFNCDFYIKSLDLFIELNLHYAHGGHWFDANNPDDVLRLKHLKEYGTALAYKNANKIWAGSDIIKRETAKKSGIRYLVFWGNNACQGTARHKDGVCDFEIWFYDYDCDYDSFILDFPSNSC